MKALFGLAALLGLSYMIADKGKIAEYRRQANVWARPFLLVVLIVFGVPLIWDFIF